MGRTLLDSRGVFQLWIVDGAYELTCTNCGFTRRYPGYNRDEAAREYHLAHGGCSIRSAPIAPLQHD